MGENIYTGSAVTLLDTGTGTVGGTIVVGDLFNVKIGSGVVSIAAATTVAASVATQIYNALIADGVPNEFDEITWTNPSAGVIAWEGPEDGRPVSQGITLTTTESNGGAADGQTFTKAVTQVGTGRYSWTNVQNWSLGAIPVNSDNVHIGLFDAAPKYDIDGQDAVTLGNLFVYGSQFSGLSVGLEKYNSVGDYPEYLPTHLELDANYVWLGVGTGTNIPKFFMNAAAGDPIYRIERSGRRINGVAPTNIFGSAGTFYIKDGAVDLGTYPGQTFVSTTVHLQGSNADVLLGKYASMNSGTLLVHAGKCTIESTSTVTLPPTVTVRSGASLTLKGGGGTISVLTVEVGAVVDVQRGDSFTVTLTKLSGTLTLTNTNGPTGRNFSNFDMYRGATLIDPYKLGTYTNGIDLNQCKLSDVTLDVGSDVRLTLGTPS